ncbi:MAG TPA: hypothetical protein VKB76_11855, partial [Ktedonobacterales bacterium]|nr:hypothetical protein [Ktedonobacterales bacterium]
ELRAGSRITTTEGQHTMIYIGFMLFVFGVAMGVWATDIYKQAHAEIAKSRDKATITELETEVKRLRAQVAGLVGRE